MWLVVGINEEEDFVPSLEVCETHDHQDEFSQLIVTTSSTILCSTDIIYAIAGSCISSTPHAFTLA